MTTEVIHPFPVGDAADDTVRSTIRALIQGRGLTVEEVAAAVGMRRTTFYRRLGGRGSVQAFGAGEVATLARFFGTPVERIYDGLGGVFVPPRDT